MKIKTNSSILLLLFLIQVIVFIHSNNANYSFAQNQNQNQNSVIGSNFVPTLKTVSSKNYISNSPIRIYNNNDFPVFGFSGDGTIDNPYLLEHISIVYADYRLISISHTNVHFNIRNSIFDGVTGTRTGISLYNVTNGLIADNSVSRSDDSIRISRSSNISIINNSLYENSISGITLYESSNNLVFGNEIYDNAINGLYLSSLSSNNTISSNRIFNNTKIGISIYNCNYFNIITNNIIHHNIDKGIYLDIDCQYNEILNNSITGSIDGIYTINCSDNIIDHNQILNNGDGIEINIDDATIISSNLIFNNSYYGINLHYIVNYCQIIRNILINNNYRVENSSQAYAHIKVGDFVPTNNFLFNYWDDWIYPDVNQDLIVDEPYQIDGSITFDLFPVTTSELSIRDHFLTKPTLLLPVYNPDSLSVDVNWIAAADSFQFPITYTLYYSIDQGYSWKELIANTVFTYFRWNASLIEYGYYQLKIVAKSTEGLTSEDISDNFPLLMEHTLTTPKIIIPDNSSTLSNDVYIRWKQANDNWNYKVSYNISYSFDCGENWVLLVSEIDALSYKWDTTTVKDGNNYKIKVVASSSGMISTFITSELLTIDNYQPNTFLSNFPFLELFFSLFIIFELLSLIFIVNFVRKKQNK